MRAKHYAVTNYWLAFYCDDHCTLCGNRGFIDTRGVTTCAGKKVGKVNYCICPNGQIMRKHNAVLPNAPLNWERSESILNGQLDVIAR